MLTPEQSRKLARIFNAPLLASLPDARADINAHILATGSLDGLDPWLAYLLDKGRDELPAPTKALDPAAFVWPLPVIEVTDEDDDWLIAVQKLHSAKNGVPTDAELDGGMDAQKFNPHHDEAGRFASGDASDSISPPSYIGDVRRSISEETTFFHGTSSSYLESIHREGLVAKGGEGGDAWAKKHGWTVNKVKVAGQEISVFVTPDLATAKMYAKLAAEMGKGTPVVISVRIPRDKLSILKPDDNEKNGLRFEGTILPEWIEDGIKAADEGRTVFLVALVDDADATKFNPYHASSGSTYGLGEGDTSEKRYDPSQARAPQGSPDGGQWVSTVSSPIGRGEFTKKEATHLTALLAEEGGFTYQPFDDTSPTDGFMLSIYQDRERIIEGKVTGSNLSGFVGNNKDLLVDSDHFFGAWVDKGKTYLDVSMRVKDALDAKSKCCEHHQLAYFDLAKMETIYVTC